jgi:TRAP transporter TAXI family solute receptor
MFKSISKKKLIIQFLVISILIFSVTGLAFTQKTYITLGTGGTGGTYFPIGGGMAELVRKYIPGFEASAEVTGASIENCRLLDTNEIQFAQAGANSVYFAYNGLEPFEKKMNILGCFNMHPSFAQFLVLKKSNINSFKDLIGKEIVIGPPGGGTYLTGLDILNAAGLTEKDFKPSYLSFSEGISAMKDGLVDVLIISSSVPNPAIMDISTTRDIKLLPLEDETFEKLEDVCPWYVLGKVPAGAYKGVNVDIPVAQRWNIVVCNSDLDEDLVYKCTKVWWEHKDHLLKIHPVIRYMSLDAATKVPIPMHPGAEKYFKEIGIIR